MSYVCNNKCTWKCIVGLLGLFFLFYHTTMLDVYYLYGCISSVQDSHGAGRLHFITKQTLILPIDFISMGHEYFDIIAIVCVCDYYAVDFLQCSLQPAAVAAPAGQS